MSMISVEKLTFEFCMLDGFTFQSVEIQASERERFFPPEGSPIYHEKPVDEDKKRQLESYIKETYSEEFSILQHEESMKCGLYQWTGKINGWKDYWGEYDEEWNGELKLIQENTHSHEEEDFENL